MSSNMSRYEQNRHQFKTIQFPPRHINDLPSFIVAYSMNSPKDSGHSVSQNVIQSDNSEINVSLTDQSISDHSRVIILNETDEDDDIIIIKDDRNIDTMKDNVSEHIPVNTAENIRIQTHQIYNVSSETNKLRNVSKRKLKSRHSMKRTSVHFKGENNKNKVRNKLKRIYRKTGNANLEQTLIISRSQVLKNVHGKGNLLDNTGSVILIGSSVHEVVSSTSSPSTIRRSSFISYSSENTLFGSSGSSSRHEAPNSSKVKNDMPSNEDTSDTSDSSKHLYTSDYNVSLAMSLASKSKPYFEKTLSVVGECEERLVSDVSMTSTEAKIHNIPLTSQLPSEIINNNITYINNDTSAQNLTESNSVSDVTLIGENTQNSLKMSSNEMFFNIESTPDLNEMSLNSSYTTTSNSEAIFRVGNILTSNKLPENNLSKNTNDMYKKTKIMETVLDIGMFPEMVTPIPNNKQNEIANNLIVVGDSIKEVNSISHQIEKDKAIKPASAMIPKFILEEPFSLDTITKQNDSNLLDDTNIKAILRMSEKSQKVPCSAEYRNNCPSNISELWEKLHHLIKTTVNKLEDSLIDKIVKEIKVQVLDNNIQSVDLEAKGDQLFDPALLISRKEQFTDVADIKIAASEGLQCNLLENNYIDRIMFTVEKPERSISHSKDESSKVSSIIPSTRIKDSIDILKHPLTKTNDSDNVTTTVTESSRADSDSVSRFKYVFVASTGFIRENLFVLTSVPAFFVALFATYGFIVAVMNL